MRKSPYPAGEITRRGMEIYEHQIRPVVEPIYRGKYLVIDVDTGEYEVAENYLLASEHLHQRHSDAALFTLRIGEPVFVRIGGHSKQVNKA